MHYIIIYVFFNVFFMALWWSCVNHYERAIHFVPIGDRSSSAKVEICRPQEGKASRPAQQTADLQHSLVFSKTRNIIERFALHNQQPPTHLALLLRLLPPHLMPSASTIFVFGTLKHLSMSLLSLRLLHSCSASLLRPDARLYIFHCLQPTVEK